ncbi:MAG: acyloxyacyl hydrolase [Hyphomicrobiales bacterium]
MTKFFKYSVAAIGLALSASAASAADLPPPPVAAPAAWSFSVFGGASWLNDVKSNYTYNDGDVIGNEDTYLDVKTNWNGKANFDTGFLVGGTFGYTFVDWARTEVEISYQQWDVNKISADFKGCANVACEDAVADLGPPGNFSFNSNANIGALTIFGNVWLGFNMLPVVGDAVNTAAGALGGLSPYFGGGIGVAFVDGNGNNGGDFNLNDSDTAFAWQVGAGLRWNFASNMGLDVGYRFRGINDVNFDSLNKGVDLTSNNVIVGLTFNF